jgi:hypothetical protein
MQLGERNGSYWLKSALTDKENGVKSRLLTQMGTDTTSTPWLASFVSGLVRFLVRRGVSIHETFHELKLAYVREGEKELIRQGQTPNASRVSALTGLHRRDVSAILATGAPVVNQKGASILARVLAKWESGKQFCDSTGKAKALTVGFAGAEFSKLVESISSDLHAGTIAQELCRAALAEERDGKLRLLGAVHIGVNQGRRLELLARDLGSLLESGEQSIHTNSSNVRHIRTDFDNIAPEKRAEIEEWLGAKQRELHKEVRTFLSQLDRDFTDGGEGDSRSKVVMSSFFHVIDEKQ